MKVLIIGPFSPPINGVSVANETLVKYLGSSGMAYNTINTKTNGVSSRQGTSFSPMKAIRFLHTYLNAYKILRSSVVYLTPGQTFFGILKYAPFLLTSMVLNKPYVIHVHGNYLGKEFTSLTGIKKKIFYFFLSKAAAGIVLSRSLVQNFEGLLQKEKVFVVNNFAEDSLYDPLSGAKPNDKLRVLYLSNLMREKGVLELLDGLAELQNRQIDFKAVLAGTIEEETGDDIRQRLKLLGNKVEFIGTVTGSDKKKVFHDANVFILPTYYTMEGQPISLLEGLATGNIIVTTNHAGIPDIINESHGFLVASKSSKAIADCLQEISGRIQHYIDKHSGFNIRYAAASFTETRFSQEVLSVLKKVSEAPAVIPRAANILKKQNQ